MPIFFQQDIDEHTKLGIWKMEEEESFFLHKVMPQRHVSHPHKKLQHLAGRYLLVYLYPDFPVELIRIADTRKPFLENEKYHFSIAHCGDYAAAIVSSVNRVGVDVERLTEKVNNIRAKFISTEEEAVMAAEINGFECKHLHASGNTTLLADIHFLTLIWSSKEAVFKWYGLGGVDFKEHMQVKSIIGNNREEYNTILAFKKGGELFLNLRTIFFNREICLSYVTT